MLYQPTLFFFFLSAPLFSIRKKNIIGYKEVDTHGHESMFVLAMLHPLVSEMKRHRQKTPKKLEYFSLLITCAVRGQAA